MRSSRGAQIASWLVLFVLAGCGGGDKSTKPIVPSDGLPAGTPAANSQAHLTQRLEATLESMVEAEYAKLLADDFRYRFSVANDPLLVDQYPNWGRTDEIAALTHLFNGFTNTNHDVIPGAGSIHLSLNGVEYQADPSHEDSTAQYGRVIITSLDGQIEVPAVSEPIVFAISSRHELFVVRGDAAVLPAGILADSTRWYLRRWDDLATPIGYSKKPVLNSAQAISFGSIRALWR